MISWQCATAQTVCESSPAARAAREPRRRRERGEEGTGEQTPHRPMASSLPFHPYNKKVRNRGLRSSCASASSCDCEQVGDADIARRTRRRRKLLLLLLQMRVVPRWLRMPQLLQAAGEESKTRKRSTDRPTVSSDLPLVDLVLTTTVHREAAGNGDSTGNKHRGASIDAPPRGPPSIRVQRKKLLILDLNGLLADINQDYHSSHLSHGKVRGKLVFKRPYCHDFLRFCIRNFKLAIWSSRLKANTDAVVDILKKDLKHHLLFCWDASKCTATGHYTIENRNKPLVLKELKKLWDKEESDLPWQQGEFSPSNTLLVDDSPYKAWRNPPNTAIFPYSYSYKNEKDDSLGPGGDLRLYLEKLATADDVQCYVMEHPFGQLPITRGNPNWKLYAKMLDGRVP